MLNFNYANGTGWAAWLLTPEMVLGETIAPTSEGEKLFSEVFCSRYSALVTVFYPPHRKNLPPLENSWHHPPPVFIFLRAFNICSIFFLSLLFLVV